MRETVVPCSVLFQTIESLTNPGSGTMTNESQFEASLGTYLDECLDEYVVLLEGRHSLYT
jgi:hypothetical protein